MNLDYFFGPEGNAGPRYYRNRKAVAIQDVFKKDFPKNDPLRGQVTQILTKEATHFIRKNKDNPFFLYQSHIMPHYYPRASANFIGKSKGGIYGDAVEG